VIPSLLAVTFGVSLIVVGWVRRYALSNNILDVPCARSSHNCPMPRGGGLAIFLSFAAASFALCIGDLLDVRTTVTLLAAGGSIGIVGFLDDRWELRARTRLAVHLAAAIMVIATLGGLPEVQLGRWGMAPFWLGSIFSVLVLVWGTNLFNFMDGIDGIAASEAIFFSVAGAWLNWPNGDLGMSVALLSVAAATLGFLAWNWPPARIFMGDVGSGFLGFMITALAILASRRGITPIEVWPILGGVFLVDATTTLIRRILRGDAFMEPHNMHAFQHLARRFNSHTYVTLIVIGVNMLWLFPWAYFVNNHPERGPLCVAAALAPLVVIALIAGAGKTHSTLSVSDGLGGREPT
jgi:Fuc2NAc and GlcNAc transferase